MEKARRDLGTYIILSRNLSMPIWFDASQKIGLHLNLSITKPWELLSKTIQIVSQELLQRY